MERGRSVNPVSSALKPNTDCVKSGIKKSRPAWAKVCVERIGRPAEVVRCRKIDGWRRAGRSSDSLFLTHQTKTPTSARPIAIRERTSGSCHPLLVVCKIPSTKRPIPDTDSPTPTTSSFGFGMTGGASVMSPDARRTPTTIRASNPKATRQLR